ncbi:hypothetical protein SLEP1_g56270 [Rubroshorea leprosula]|uniref:Uncharacterized protein n=1 Tax=Rubroshorea leprosula TaxID=152421 RepID=A0AAV5MHU8_9ROSI|nr:hypothetical protein SLEP1_g56270 [Rubroshorea leprosula]
MENLWRGLLRKKNPCERDYRARRRIGVGGKSGKTQKTDRSPYLKREGSHGDQVGWNGYLDMAWGTASFTRSTAGSVDRWKSTLGREKILLVYLN